MDSPATTNMDCHAKRDWSNTQDSDWSLCFIQIFQAARFKAEPEGELERKEIREEIANQGGTDLDRWEDDGGPAVDPEMA